MSTTKLWCLVSQPNSVVLEVEVDLRANGQECLEKVWNIWYFVVLCIFSPLIKIWNHVFFYLIFFFIYTQCVVKSVSFFKLKIKICMNDSRSPCFLGTKSNFVQYTSLSSLDLAFPLFQSNLISHILHWCFRDKNSYIKSLKMV